MGGCERVTSCRGADQAESHLLDTTAADSDHVMYCTVLYYLTGMTWYYLPFDKR